MPTREAYLRGTDEVPEARVHLKAGPLTMAFEPSQAFLRYIRLGDQEILRGIYAAVRDHNWDTISPNVSNVQIVAQRDSFRVAFDVLCVEHYIDFAWKGTIIGEADGTVTFAFDGEARSAFNRNRIGCCVLHAPSSVAGNPCRVEKDDGTVEEGVFPEAISPHQPFMNMRAISHEVLPGVTAEVRFSGDVFEMEDQRNWTDASYKTYCTPLGLPFPVEVAAGTRIEQSVTVRIHGEPATPIGANETDAVVVIVDPDTAQPLPAVGLGAGGCEAPLTESEILNLRLMHLSHLRVDVNLVEPAWQAVMSHGIAQAVALGVPAEMVVFVSDAARAELQSLVDVMSKLRPDIARWLIFHVAEKSTTKKWVRVAREVLGAYDTSIPIVSGTNWYFTELNRARPPVNALDGVCYSLNPQGHAFDDASLSETLEAQAWTVESARGFVGGLPIHISPVTFRPRFNMNTIGPEPDPEPGQLPASVDPRQMSLFGAGWTVGSLKYLSLADVASVTYFETVGWLGVMESASGSPAPEAFPSVPGGIFPVGHVFSWYGGMKGGEALATRSSAPLFVEALALRKGEWIRLLLANLTGDEQSAEVRLPGVSDPVRIEVLDEESVEQATIDPTTFRRRKDVESVGLADGVFTVNLKPFAVACAKVQVMD